MQLRVNLYKGVGADKLSTNVIKQEGETSYIYSVALVTGVPLQNLYLFTLASLKSLIAYVYRFIILN